MVLSKNILALLNFLAKQGLSFDHEFLSSMAFMEDDPDDIKLSDKEKAEIIEFKTALRQISASILKLRTEPSKYLRNDNLAILNKIYSISDEDPLDEYLTYLSLENVPCQVDRLKKLRPLYVKSFPNSKVAKYFNQASWCFIDGLYDAVAVLSRSIIEFCLEDILERLNFPYVPEQNRKNYLENLIDFAGKIKYGRMTVLNHDSLEYAHRIRKIGNKAIHENSTNEQEAAEAIDKTVKTLSYIYSNILIAEK